MSVPSKQLQFGVLTAQIHKTNTKLTKNYLATQGNLRKAEKLAKEYADAKKVINANFADDSQSIQREMALQQVKDEFDFLKAQLNKVDEENAAEKQALETKKNFYMETREAVKEDISEEVKKRKLFKLSS